MRLSRKASKPTQKTRKGYEIPARKREDVLRDFRKIVGPLRGRNRDRIPKT
jgi:hypothetical protein